MKRQQSGFTLVEIAIVLVIIGLLLGGILKGQELINSAKVKNLANDFRVIPTYIYAYQDKYRALPGDDPRGPDARRRDGHAGRWLGLATVLSTAPGTLQQRPTSRSCSGSTCASRTSPLVRAISQMPAYIPTNAVGGSLDSRA